MNRLLARLRRGGDDEEHDSPDAEHVVVPREVGLAVRGGRLRAETVGEVTPPPTYDPDDVDRAATASATGAALLPPVAPTAAGAPRPSAAVAPWPRGPSGIHSVGAVRDALLVHHALTASKKDGLRRELLTSRLVRFHWDRHHMAAVKRAYAERYGKELADELAKYPDAEVVGNGAGVEHREPYFAPKHFVDYDPSKPLGERITTREGSM